MPRGVASITRLAWDRPPFDNDVELSRNATFHHVQLICTTAHIPNPLLSGQGILRVPLPTRKSPIAIAVEELGPYRNVRHRSFQ